MIRRAYFEFEFNTLVSSSQMGGLDRKAEQSPPYGEDRGPQEAHHCKEHILNIVILYLKNKKIPNYFHITTKRDKISAGG